ncbi:DASS family sodium-coupled anion symporter [Clavibacter phaseoli]|uniref:DASS family sodium-coupled anion symporter n=2 Tax=Clavibacter phaseoli TaxID=1734031 RepID=UPI001F3F45C9|nr:DASS family sodium-coupled anion symporter [Clavibacter phaseoli]UKF30177.1 DASS family sodium-coupled anion symporter [Clavibacter phaseoli]UKF36095.1 DASS family sodium-coupled anion symporter [Clavibacter phaseoli]
MTPLPASSGPSSASGTGTDPGPGGGLRDEADPAPDGVASVAPDAPAAPAAEAAARRARRARRSRAIQVVVIVAVAVGIALVPPPAGVDPRGMHMAGIFVGTVLALILQPLPTAPVALTGLAVAMLTGTMTTDGEALVGFANPTIWLIVASFFIADGFLVTGLGRRIALAFVARLGGSSLGLAYGMALTDLVLAPATPSNTARAGGVVYPIVASLSRVQGSTPDSDASRRRLGSYLALTSVQVNTVTSAMFVTAMAGNPVAQKAAADLGIEITWGGWALAALVPGLLSLVVVPWAMARVYPPTLTRTPEAPAHAKAELRGLGPLSGHERIMAATFVLLLVLWCGGSLLGIPATAAAFGGIAVLLVTGVLRWSHLAANASAWSTLIFFAVLVGMADQLDALGVIDLVGGAVSGSVGGLPWPWAFAVLALVYFFSHYLFASNTAHIVAMYAVFLGAAVATGTPPLFAALVLGFVGNLFGGISHYASGPSGVVFGSGYVTTKEWFRVGFAMAVVLIVIWGVVGTAWMSVLGLLA